MVLTHIEFEEMVRNIVCDKCEPIELKHECNNINLIQCIKGKLQCLEHLGLN